MENDTFMFCLQLQVILCSHGGRPKGEVVESMRFGPVAKCLLDLLDHPIVAPDDCVGDIVEAQVPRLQLIQLFMVFFVFL